MVAARHIKLTAIKEYVISRLFRRATGCKYIRLQSLCQVKIEEKKNHFLRAKIHLTRRLLLIYQQILYCSSDIFLAPTSYQKQLEFIFTNAGKKINYYPNTITIKKVLNFLFSVHFLEPNFLKERNIREQLK
jgi:hypothetical protein